MKKTSTRNEQAEYAAWLETRERVRKQRAQAVIETNAQKESRIKKLLQPAHFEEFCSYYFGHYMDSPFGWFHKKAAKDIFESDNSFNVWEWAREHAKSVLADVFIPLWLKANGKLDGMILASESAEKAKGLLKDMQMELEDNQRYRADFGEQSVLGSWQQGHYTTADGIGFWAFGLGQNPAGSREGARRPNYGVVDDADSKAIAKNQTLTKEALDWILGEFMGCLSIKGKRFVYTNNRVAKNGITAHLVGDIEPGDPKRPGINHIKVYATEDPKTHQMLKPFAGGVPAWKERYTVEHIVTRIGEMGYRNSERQFYHQHVEDGNVFKGEHINWGPMLAMHKYDALVVYVDPSYKDTKKNDFKAIVLLGKTGRYYHIIWAWVRQATKGAMISAHCNLFEEIRDGSPTFQADGACWREVICRHYIEANFMQGDTLMPLYEEEAAARQIHFRPRGDERKKPDKFGRIEDLSPFWESGLFVFNEKLKKTPDMQTLKDQFLAFPNGHDDGPDAVEGACYYLSRKTKSATTPARTGRAKTNRSRNAH